MAPTPKNMPEQRTCLAGMRATSVPTSAAMAKIAPANRPWRRTVPRQPGEGRAGADALSCMPPFYLPARRAPRRARGPAMGSIR